MAKTSVTRKEVLDGELVSVFCEEGVDTAYKLGDSIYTIVTNTIVEEYKCSSGVTYRYEKDGGKAWYDTIRHARLTAVTPYSKDPADISNLTKNQSIAFRYIVDNGGVISRKKLSDMMGITPRSAIMLMYKLLDEGLVAVGELDQCAHLSNSADNVVFD